MNHLVFPNLNVQLFSFFFKAQFNTTSHVYFEILSYAKFKNLMLKIKISVIAEPC